ARLKGRPGFHRLTGDESHHVLRPLAEACDDPRDDLTHPSLFALARYFAPRLADAEEEAIDRLDALLAAKDQGTVVKVVLPLRHREVASEAEVDALLSE